MKRSKMFRLLTVCTFIVASTIFANLLMAQTDVRYRIHWITGPDETTQWQLNDLLVTTDENDYPITALVVGSYYRSDRPTISGFVYDVFGNTIVPNLTNRGTQPIYDNRFWDIEELADAPDGWGSTTQTSLRGVNSAGLIAGYARDSAGIDHAVYLDLDNPDPITGYKLVPLPRPVDNTGTCRGRDVTELGDILVNYQSTLDGDWRAYVYNTDSGPEDIASGGEPIVFASEYMHLNLFRQVVGTRADYMAIRHSMSNDITEEFPNLAWPEEINDVGQFAANANNIRGRHQYATRVEANGSIEWTAAEKGTDGNRINYQGDLLFTNLTTSERFYYHEGLKESFNLKDLVIAGSDPDFWFRDQDHLGWMRVSDRDFTGFGWVAKALRVTDSDGLQTWKLALLIPEVPQPTVSASWSQIEEPPLKIPDINTGVAVSTLTIPAANDFEITSITVTLDINHPRPSDLEAWLSVDVADSPRVPLTNFSGDNPIPDAFDGIRTGGTKWTIEVSDNRRKKEGTLNGWSITVDY